MRARPTDLCQKSLTMKVSFLGLGIMGSRMAKNLLQNGVDLTVWNRSPEPREKLAKAGAKTAATAAAAAAEADLVISMLATPEVVDEVIITGGVLGALPKGAIWADASTVNPSFASTCARAAEQAGLRYLGIPVAGTRGPAEKGELKVLVGGPKATLEEVRSVLDGFSSGIIHVGEGYDRGAAFKILVNGMLAQSMLVFSETVLLGEAMGLDRDFLLKALSGLPVIAPFVGMKTEMIKSNDYADAAFPLELMHKDLHLAVQTAYEVDQPVFLASMARELYGQAKQSGRGREDFAGIHGYLAEPDQS